MNEKGKVRMIYVSKLRARRWTRFDSRVAQVLLSARAFPPFGTLGRLAADALHYADRGIACSSTAKQIAAGS